MTAAHATTQAVNDSNEESPQLGNLYQPDILVQQFAAVEQSLYNASAIIESSRRGLHDCKALLIASNDIFEIYERGYNEERHSRIECARAYNDVCTSYEMITDNYKNVGDKYLNLLQEHEQTQDIVTALESKLQQYEQLQGVSDVHGVDYATWHRYATENEHLQTRIRDLEDEKSDMIKEHRNALTNVVNQPAQAKADGVNMTQGTVESRVSGSVARKPSSEPERKVIIGQNGRKCETDHAETDRQLGRKARKSRKRMQEVKVEVQDG